MIDIRGRGFSKTDSLFFDANVWIYILGFQGRPNNWRTRVYSGAFKGILEAKATVYVDALVLSEVANTWAREVFKPFSCRYNRSFKAFRKSKDFPVADIADGLRRIKRTSVPIDTPLTAINLGELIDTFEAKHPDFNDEVFVRTCQKEGFLLVTHDADFRGTGIDILTANKRLL